MKQNILETEKENETFQKTRFIQNQNNQKSQFYGKFIFFLSLLENSTIQKQKLNFFGEATEPEPEKV